MKIKYLGAAAVALLAGATIAQGAQIAQAADATTPEGSALQGVQGVSAGQDGGAEKAGRSAVTDTEHASGQSSVGVGFKVSDQGGLTLNFVPNFDFGTNHDMGTGSETLNLFSKGAPTTKDEPGRVLAVTDFRGATDAKNGYTVQVSMGKFYKVKDSDNTLDKSTPYLNGATLTLGDANGATPIKGGVLTENGIDNYGTSSVPKPATLTTKQVKLQQNDALQAIMTSAKSETPAVGTWAVDFSDKNSAELDVPAAVQDHGKFVAQLNWDLGSATN
ncbi:WxL domain-containing protein [Lactobacillus sp. CC-MHH1034]|uniref:WxL domain-containing protein n=1 Tax=Agrilactobacillus fermenti TaxID=2586909 RepID=UPI001E4CB217|nr:WxL domain-containing protein [Agrilactobacillus fermenti]MCD2256947.1 WxL domain-containing protein [Agrilactobacillus fermenti]